MPIRDLVLILIVFGTIAPIMRDPYFGVVVWNWLAFMNPHQYTWEFARSLRLSLVIAVATLFSFFFFKGPKRIAWRAPVVLMGILVAWVGITTVLALNPEGAQRELERFVKIIVMIFLAVALVRSRERLDWLIWVTVISLGFFGFKGGIFTIAHAGAYRVGGPPGSFIEDNNALAFALVICLPLMRYLQLQATNKKIKIGLGVLMFLTGCSILGSWSRGALLAAIGMTLALWLRSRRKLLLSLAFAAAIPFMLSVMPEGWYERMDTIESYQEDGSAMGRINAWKFAWNVALDHPVFGGGANVFTPRLFQKYAPEPNDFHDSHSIYFEMLAEQGFLGLAIFIAVGLTGLAGASKLMRMSKGRAALSWAYDLGAMCQVGIVGYAIGGAFLGLAYFDLPYTIVAFVVIARGIVEAELSAQTSRVDPRMPLPEVAGISEDPRRVSSLR